MNKKIFSIKNLAIGISILFLIHSVIQISVILSQIQKDHEKIEDFFIENHIQKIELSIPVPKSSHISATLYISQNHLDLTNKSLPTIIFIPGANALKYRYLDRKLMLVEEGYAVLAMEQRGHGESGGYFTMYEIEPYDVSSVIDYLDVNYPQINSTHVGLIGISLGGGTSLFAQALDNRIHASSIYHPVSNMTDIFQIIGVNFPQIIGFTYGMTIPDKSIYSSTNWDEILGEYYDQKGPINLINSSNTKNLLLIHGSDDDVVRMKGSLDVITKLDPENLREDIQLVIREGFGHGQNERDDISFIYALTWLNHFYFNSSLNINDLSAQIQSVDLPVIDFPPVSNQKKDIELFTISLFLGLFFLIFFSLHPIFGTRKTINNNQIDEREISDDLEHKNPIVKQKYNLNIKNILIIRSLIVLFSFLISAIYAYLRNPSLFYSIFFNTSYIAIPLLLLIPMKKEKHNIIHSIKNEWKIYFRKENILRFIEVLIIIGLPTILFYQLSNFRGRMVLDERYRVETLILIRYISIFTMCLLFSSIYLRDISFKYSPIIIIVFGLGIFITTIFLPFTTPDLFLDYIDPKYGIFLFCLVGGLIFYLFYFVLFVLSKLITQNTTATAISIGILITLLLHMRFFRLI